MRIAHRILLPGGALVLAALPLLPARLASAADVRGTISYHGKSAALRFAAMITGPDEVDGKKTIRRVVLTGADLRSTIARCPTMSCVDAAVADGMEIDFDAGPRLNYWVVLDGQKTQYSGTAVPESLTAGANDARRIAGRLSIDDSAAGGPAIEVEFDAPLVRTFDRSR